MTTIAVGQVVPASMINQWAPPGAVVQYAGAAAPSGWFICDGSAISRTTYSDLFTAIGVLYGSGDGSLTFNLPDARGRVIAGYAPSGGHSDVSTLGNNDGVTLANRRPKHRQSHSLAISGGSHAHNVTYVNGGINGPNPGASEQGFGTSYTNATAAATHTHPNGEFSGTIGASASDSLDAPAYLVLNHIIRAKDV